MAFGYLFGGYTGVTIGLGIAIVFNFFSYWYSDKIVLKIYHGKEVNAKQNPKLHKIMGELCMKSGLPKPKIYLIPDKNANAFATGRSKNHAVVAFSLGIIELLNEEELKGVAAHELAHIKNKDIIISSVVAMVATAISYIAFVARFAAFFVGTEDADGHSGLELLMLGILAPILALLIQTTISRTREYLADETAAKMMGTGLPLAEALQKLKSDRTIMRFGNSSSAHLFIKNPFKGEGLLNLLSTHPPLGERISRLRSMII
jgi:heat shock protein HtpX